MRHLTALLLLAALVEARPTVRRAPPPRAAPPAAAPARGPLRATSGTFNCGIWGTCTGVVQEAITQFDDQGNPTRMLISGKALDSQSTERGRFRMIYDYASGAVLGQGVNAPLYTETAGHQTTIASAAAVPPLIAQSALASTNCPGVATCAVTLVRPQ